MKLSDLSTGPGWVPYVVFAVVGVIAVVLLSGHGSWLIAGYNTASKQKKANYDAKKLCRVTGAGMAVIAVFILIMAVFQDVLPAYFANIATGIIILDVILIVILTNTICKR